MQSRVAIFFGLNAIRFFSLVGLILVFASSIVVLVNDIHAIQRAGQPQVIDGSDGEAFDQAECFDYLEGSTVPNQPAGAFWAIVNRFLIIFEIIFLFMSEVGWPSKFFATYFPVLGPDFGVGALGVFECLIGAAVLSHRVNDFALVSAFFLFSVGCLNILAGLIFRESSRPRRSLTEWHDSKKPMLPTTIIPRDQLDSGASSFISNAEKAYPLPIHSGHPTPIEATPIHGEYASASLQPGKGFGRAAGMGENSGPKRFLISRPMESLPRYHTRPGPSPVPGAYPSGGAGF